MEETSQSFEKHYRDLCGDYDRQCMAKPLKTDLNNPNFRKHRFVICFKQPEFFKKKKLGNDLLSFFFSKGFAYLLYVLRQKMSDQNQAAKQAIDFHYQINSQASIIFG